MRNEINSITTVSQNPDRAAEIIEQIKKRKISPTARANIESAAGLKREARHLSNTGDNLGAAARYHDARELLESTLLEIPSDRQPPLTEKVRASDYSATEEIAVELSKGSNRDYLDQITKSNPGRFVDFANLFRRIAGWKRVIQNVSLFPELPLTERDKYLTFENQLKGTKLQIDVAQALGPNHIAGFETNHKTKVSSMRSGRIDVTTTNGIAIECKSYSSGTIIHSMGDALVQAADRLQSDVDTQKAYKETIIVVPDETDMNLANREFEKQIKRKGLARLSGRIKLWTVSMLGQQTEKGYFDK